MKRDPSVFRKYLDGSLMRRLTLKLSILLLFVMTEPGHSQKIQATVWKLTQGLIWKSTRQIHRIILRLYHISQLLILLLLFMTAPAPPSKNVGHCLEMIQDLSWRMLIQLCRLPCLGIQILGIHRFSFGHTGKCIHIMKE